MTAQNIGGRITGHFKYQFLLLFCHGDFEVTIENGGAQLYTSMPMVFQQKGSKMLPAVGVDSFSFNINKDKVSISISGSFEADFLNIFVQVF